MDVIFFPFSIIYLLKTPQGCRRPESLCFSAKMEKRCRYPWKQLGEGFKKQQVRKTKISPRSDPQAKGGKSKICLRLNQILLLYRPSSAEVRRWADSLEALLTNQCKEQPFVSAE